MPTPIVRRPFVEGVLGLTALAGALVILLPRLH